MKFPGGVNRISNWASDEFRKIVIENINSMFGELKHS